MSKEENMHIELALVKTSYTITIPKLLAEISTGYFTIDSAVQESLDKYEEVGYISNIRKETQKDKVLFHFEITPDVSISPIEYEIERISKLIGIQLVFTRALYAVHIPVLVGTVEGAIATSAVVEYFLEEQERLGRIKNTRKEVQNGNTTFYFEIYPDVSLYPIESGLKRISKSLDIGMVFEKAFYSVIIPASLVEATDGALPIPVVVENFLSKYEKSSYIENVEKKVNEDNIIFDFVIDADASLYPIEYGLERISKSVKNE